MKLILIALLFLTHIANAGPSLTTESAQNYLQIQREYQSIRFGGQRPSNATALEVTIVDPTDQRFEYRSQQPWFEYLLPIEAADGLYRYEVLYSILPAEKTPTDSNTDTTTTVRSVGTFRVYQGEIIHSLDTHEDMHLYHPNANSSRQTGIVYYLAKTLDWLISDANASDLIVASKIPRITFDDTQDEDCSPDADWEIVTNGGNSDTSVMNTFGINSVQEPSPCVPAAQAFMTSVFTLFDDGTTANSGLFRGEENGDVNLGQNSFYFDKSANFFGVGTLTPNEDIEIQSTSPRIYFDDTNVASTAEYSIGESNGDFTLQLHNNTAGGPEGFALTLDSPTGQFGFYDASPEATLDVSSPDLESAKILIKNPTGIIAARTLFELRNPGNTKFEIVNTHANESWAFTNSGTDFRMSLQGSGVVEFRVDNNGDAFLEGVLTEGSDRNSKTRIKTLDYTEVLAKVQQLPISQWQYKNAPGKNHIGPMAQDFYAAFGLGDSDKHLATLDTSGVALAAIKALADENQQLKNQLAEVNAKLRQVDDLHATLIRLQKKIEAPMLVSD